MKIPTFEPNSVRIHVSRERLNELALEAQKLPQVDRFVVSPPSAHNYCTIYSDGTNKGAIIWAGEKPVEVTVGDDIYENW